VREEDRLRRKDRVSLEEAERRKGEWHGEKSSGTAGASHDRHQFHWDGNLNRNHSLDGLADEPRPGIPRSITDAQVEQAVSRPLETTPRDATHWSSRLLARELGLSQTAVSRIWRAFGLKPHRRETFKLSADPFFVEKVRDVVGLYLAPPERAIVLCVDEKSQVQA
jgi:hypothetical protein